MAGQASVAKAALQKFAQSSITKGTLQKAASKSLAKGAGSQAKGSQITPAAKPRSEDRALRIFNKNTSMLKTKAKKADTSKRNLIQEHLSFLGDHVFPKLSHAKNSTQMRGHANALANYGRANSKNVNYESITTLGHKLGVAEHKIPKPALTSVPMSPAPNGPNANFVIKPQVAKLAV